MVEYPRLFTESIYDLQYDIRMLSCDSEEWYNYFKFHVDKFNRYKMTDLTFDQIMFGSKLKWK